MPVADRGYEDKDNNKEGIKDDVRWVHGKSGGRVFVFMEDIEGDIADVDTPESGADAGRAGGGMVITSSSSHSFPLSLSRSR